MEFNGTPRPTVGAEYELQLVDANSHDLVDGILPLLEILPDTPYIHPEYIQYSVEISSRVCDGVQELERHLLEQVSELQDKCQQLGMRLCGSGTHPFCDRLGIVTPLPRYRQVEEDTGYAGYAQIAYAIHVHIGIRDGDEAIRVMQQLRPYLPVFLALSASSPFWWGQDTGFASYRQRINMAAHAYGTPPQVDSWEDFQRMWQAMQRGRVFDTFSDMHWDLRPRPDFGTLEIRAMDDQPTVGQTAALVSLVRATTELLKRRDPSAPPLLGPLPLWMEHENHYRASHEGLEAQMLVTEAGDTRPMREVAEALIEEVTPMAQQLGEYGYLRTAAALLNRPEYQRQRELYAETGSLKHLVAGMVRDLDGEVQALRQGSLRRH